MKSFFKGIGILLFAILMGCCLGCFSSLWASPQTFLSTPISVAVISGEDKADFESKISPLLKEQLKNCSACSFQNLTPYTAEGKMALAELPARLEAAGSSSSFIFVHWNAKVTEETKPILATLKKIVQNGTIVIGSAGLAKDTEPTFPLNKTVLGQAAGVVIIGDLAEKERLLTQSYFGPEMLTAIKPPKDYVGLGFSPIFFVSRLASQWPKKTGKDWISHFQTTKGKVRHIWPGLDDFFGRSNN
jgi:hypothetical protein